MSAPAACAASIAALSSREATVRKGRGQGRAGVPATGAAAGGFLRSPNRTRLSAAATIASSFERGAQPSSCRAFALLAFLSLPS
jgi:hypothetical protein